ncbi:Uncharacterised protein [Helicobacter fennelliae]|uniref:Integral membrane protein n=1 Tax=Helicobacter fennelliae TaxID=215 RepID=A0A2X3EFA2_9HELI|nr:Uncharacterised protein [Helicobacter fennelliae]
MSKKDSIKENINTLRVFSVLFVTSIFGVLGYAVANLESITILKMFVGVVILLFLVLAFVFVMLKYKEQTKILEELE